MSKPGANKRLEKELQRIKEQSTEGIYIDLEHTTTFHWRASIEGPEGTPFEGGDFVVTMTFPQQYPFKPPTVKFETKMFHPNVYKGGDICLDILAGQWQPTYTGEKTLLSIQSLFTDPNPASPANGAAGQMYSKDRKKYNLEVKKYTEKHASANFKARKERERKAKETEEKESNKRKREEMEPTPPPAQKSPEDRMVEQMKEKGCTDEQLVRSLLPIVAGDLDLLTQLYNDQQTS